MFRLVFGGLWILVLQSAWTWGRDQGQSPGPAQAAGWNWTLPRAFGKVLGRSGGHSSFQRTWTLACIFCLCLLRVGEASHPGPGDPPGLWTFGIANPSGLNSKVDQVAHMPGDVWILSETQLSVTGIGKFTKGLRALKSPWVGIVPGAPCPNRNQQGTGVHSGVLLVSKFPARPLPHQFAEHTYETARIQVAGVAVHDAWVTTGMLYGHTLNGQHKHAKYHTDTLLSELIDRVACQSLGPRIIGGDFNFGPDELSQLQRLASLGFREVQDIAALRWGQSAQATGRGRRRIDQMWISPELQLLLDSVTVTWDLWADHAAVVASFRGVGVRPCFDFWRTPAPFPWPKTWTCQASFDPSQDPTVAYGVLWNQIEQQAVQWNAHHGVPCSKAQLGRGQTLQTVKRKHFQVPCKKARAGEVNPGFLGVSLQHARFFRQLRRLQALVQICKADQLSSNAQLNRDATWRACRYAPGFQGGFGGWWEGQQLAPCFGFGLPLVCPALAVLEEMFQSFGQWIKTYEATLAQQRYQFGKSRRLGAMRYVFKDCKVAALPQVDTLLDRLEVVIEEIRADESALVLEKPIHLLPGLPVVIQGKVIEVIHQEHDQVWVDDVEGITVGQSLVQEQAVMDEAAIIQRFHEVWSPRWNKVQHVVAGQWDQICGFIERVMPPVHWEHASWSLNRFQSAVARKKKVAAKGPDGVSQPDLMHLPPQAGAAFVQLYQAVESGTSWPSQVAAGAVSSLAKHLQAQHVDEFRPVTVYSLVYRLWSTERAKEALRSLAREVPDSVQGGLPHRHAKMIWYEVAQALEHAFLEHSPVHGLMVDVRKAFNNIPRFPLWCALQVMRFPESVLRAWCGFVSSQSRRFKVRQATGPPVFSNCGLPEGCALSVFGMVVIDWILDLWLGHQVKQVNFRAFIDDWGFLFLDSSVLPKLWSALVDFVRLLDLSLDEQKTKVWSSHAAARAEFRDADFQLAHFARNLGAHQNYTRHAWNSVLQNRLQVMPTIWQKLRTSLCPYGFKLKALPVLAWPRALHGISVVHLGKEHFKTLRSGAMRGLRADRKGSNPFLHLAAGGLESDPEAWTIQQTIRDAREMGGFERLESLLGLFASGHDGLPRNGPTSVLLARLRRVGWQVGENGLITDQLGTFSLLGLSWDELMLRLRLAWGSVLQEEVSHRATFRGLCNVDLAETKRLIGKFGVSDQVYLRCLLDGTLFVRNGRAKWQEGASDKCPWCDSKDGFEHRAWICPFFEPCRAHLTSEQRAAAANMPPCFAFHGWALVLDEWKCFAQQLLRVGGFSCMSPVGLSKVGVTGWCDLFIDGTCANPTEMQLRYGAWAVTFVPGGPGTLDNQLILGGHVHGLCQSAFRAELAGVCHALEWAEHMCLQVRLWSDCQGVVNGVRRLLAGGRVRPNRSHSDLWQRIADVLRRSELEIRIIKVVSHCKVSSATTPLEEWVYWHNQVTDNAAAAINERRSELFWQTWQALKHAIPVRRALHEGIVQMLLQQGRVANAQQKTQQPVVRPVVAAPEVLLPSVPNQWVFPSSMVKRYGHENVHAMHTWWSQCGSAALRASGQLQLVSGIQLFLDFAWITRHAGPFVHRKKWFSSFEEAPRGTVECWGDRVRAFLSLWIGYLKTHKIAIPNKVARPSGYSISKFVVAYYLYWPPSKIEETDRHIFAVLGKQLTSTGDIQRLTPDR